MERDTPPAGGLNDSGGVTPESPITFSSVVARLVPAIHVLAESREDVDPRNPPGSSPGSRRGSRSSRLRLLELDLRAHLFEGGFDLLGLVLGDAFLDRLRRAFDQVLGLLEAEAGERTHLLDDLDLLVARRGEHDRELGLLLGRSSGTAGARDRGGRGHAPLLLEHLGELGRLEHGQARELIDDLRQVSHFSYVLFRFEPWITAWRSAAASGFALTGIGLDHAGDLGGR